MPRVGDAHELLGVRGDARERRKDVLEEDVSLCTPNNPGRHNPIHHETQQDPYRVKNVKEKKRQHQQPTSGLEDGNTGEELCEGGDGGCADGGGVVAEERCDVGREAAEAHLVVDEAPKVLHQLERGELGQRVPHLLHAS